MSLVDQVNESKGKLYPLVSRLASRKLFLTLTVCLIIYDDYTASVTEMVRWLDLVTMAGLVAIYCISDAWHSAAKERARADVEVAKITNGAS